MTKGGWLFGAWLMSATAQANASPYLERDNPLRALVPSASALRARDEARLEAQIARGLSDLSDVRSAEVVLSLPALEQLALDQPPPGPRANLLLALTGPGPSDQQVREVVRGTLPELSEASVHIVRTRARKPSAAAPEGLVRVGPFVVTRESSLPLRASLAVCLGANALLAALLLARLRAR